MELQKKAEAQVRLMVPFFFVIVTMMDQSTKLTAVLVKCLGLLGAQGPAHLGHGASAAEEEGGAHAHAQSKPKESEERPNTESRVR